MCAPALTWKERLFFPVFTSISGLGFGFKVKIRITSGEGLMLGMSQLKRLLMTVTNVIIKLEVAAD